MPSPIIARVMPRRRSPSVAREPWYVRLLLELNRAYAHGYHRLTLRSPCRLPDRGPAILVCNHISGLDPALVQAVSPRMIRWMMAKEYYDVKALTGAFRALGAIPVDRAGRDSTATRAALRLLDAGEVLGLFPEGRIATTPDVLPFQAGVAVLAGRTGAPVFPAYIDGTNRGRDVVPAILRRCQAQVAFGSPLRFNRIDAGGENAQPAADRIRRAVIELQSSVKLPRTVPPV